MQQTYFTVRGQGGAQTVVLVDGMMTNGMMGDGAVQAYHNETMTQEAVYQTAGGNAETLTGGVNMNLIPKDGGNQWRGGFKALQVAEELAGRQPHRRSARAQRHRRRQDRQLLRVERRAGRPDRAQQAVVLRRVPPRQVRPADCQHLLHARERAVPGRLPRVLAARRGLRTGHLRREDEQPGRPPDVAGVRAQQVRRLHGPRAAPARPRDGLAHRPAHRVGDLEHADVRHRLAQVDLDAVVEAAARDRLLVQPRALRQPLSARRARRARHRRVVPQRRARTTPAPACCGTRRARSSATIRTATTSRARSRTSPARTT